MTLPNDNLMAFSDFRAAVGAAEKVVRNALNELNLLPVRRLEDTRLTGYRPEWVEVVRQHILSKLDPNQKQS